MSEQTMKVRITKGSGWYTDKVGEVFEVYHLPSDYWLETYGAIAYRTTDDCTLIIRDRHCTIIPDAARPRVFLVDGHAQFGCTLIPHIEPEYPWYQLDPAVFDPLVDDECVFFRKILEVNPRLWDTLPSVGAAKSVVEQYKAGILRQGGPLEVCETCGQEIKDE